MMNILTKWKVNLSTYFFFFLTFLCGYFKNTCLIFFLVIIHELGHVFCTYLCHYQVIKIELYPFGGMTTIDKPVNSSINKDLFIACGGFLFQLIGQIIILILFNLELIRQDTFELFCFYNWLLFIFNLLPMTPLDGAKIMQGLCEKIWPYEKALHYTNIISIIMLFLFFLINIYWHLDNYMICSFLLITFFTILKEQKYLVKRFYLERYLRDYPYRKIENNHIQNIHLLKKETLHFFKKDGHYIHEKKVLQSFFNH